MVLQIGDEVGPYRITEVHGTGGMATVYRAYHARLDRDVAIKVMHQTFLQDPSFRARFEREARIVARLEHPNIVPVYDYDDFDGQPCLVMKFIEGETLKDRLRTGDMGVGEILGITSTVADALTYAHAHGVLHRDIKPSNILLDGRGTPYLTDFGLARIAQAGESTMSADMMLGTPQYISPEQARGEKDLTPATDIYSLGIVLYEMVVGRVPFMGDTTYAIVHDHIYSSLPKPSDLNPDVPPAVERVLLKALAKEPKDRYETPNAMMADFRKVVMDAAPEVPEAAREADFAPRFDGPTVLTGEDEDIDVMSGLGELGQHLSKMGREFGDKMRTTFEENAEDKRVREYKRGPLKVTVDVDDKDSGDKGKKSKKGSSSKRRRKEEEANLTPEEKLRKRVEERIAQRQEALRDLFMHILIFTLINVWLFGLDDWIREIINTGGSWDAIVPDGWSWLTLLWGIGVISQIGEYYNKFGPGYRRYQRTLEREIERERRLLYGENASKRKNEDVVYDDGPPIRLTGDGELTDSFIDEVIGDEKQKRR